MDVSARINGISDLDRTFRNLPRSSQIKAFRPALRAGGMIIRNLASQNVKSVTSNKATGLLARSLRVYNFRNVRGALRVGVQVKRGQLSKKGVRVGLYAGVLEYGKANQAPRSWIRKAIREGESRVLTKIRQEIGPRMIQAIQDARR